MNQRLVVFIDRKADTKQVPYILNQWDYVVETPYANVSPVEKFPCNQDRPRDNAPRDLLVMNHFAYNRVNIGRQHIDTPLHPNQITKHAYNSLDSLQAHVDTCKQIWEPHQQTINYITLDYYDVGNGSVFRIVDELNGVNTSK
ncbi:hypothetical protein GGI07_004813 [Coemansia sp. Benny D115]|nr:hypothetical protein GGI07_004813 [Coemansia sp. Benny D115]